MTVESMTDADDRGRDARQRRGPEPEDSPSRALRRPWYRTGRMDPGPVESVADGASHPLSRVALGIRVRVDAILFELPRRECDELGLREDMVVRPMAWVPGGVLVEFPDGTTERVDTEIAEFVSVRLRRSRFYPRRRETSGGDGEHR